MSKKHKHYPAPEMVDLGLPSGLKWAKCNIGACEETDYGLYFKHGEVVGHTSDELDHLAHGYPETFADTATAVYGEGYRMPTKAELQELIDGTDREVSIINGVKGMKYMRKSNHNIYIFIPFEGHCYGGSFFRAGSDGYLWSRTLSSTGVAYYLYCNSGGGAGIDEDYRNFGFSVRAVSE